LLPNLFGQKLSIAVKWVSECPVGSWFRAVLEPFLRETLIGEKSLGRGLFRPEIISRFVSQHTSGE